MKTIILIAIALLGATLQAQVVVPGPLTNNGAAYSLLQNSQVAGSLGTNGDASGLTNSQSLALHGPFSLTSSNDVALMISTLSPSGGSTLGMPVAGSNGAALLMTLGIDQNGKLATNASQLSGGTNVSLSGVVSGAAGNVQFSGVGTLPLSQLPAQAVTNILPTAISQNLFNWWDAELMGYTNGQTISQWMPLVGTNILTAGGSPIYTNNGIGGHPAIYFDGVSAVYTNQNYAANNPQLNTNCAIFVVYKNFNEAAVPYGVYLWSFGTPTTPGLLFFPELNVPGTGTAVTAIGGTNGYGFLAANSMNQRDNVAAFWEYNQTNGGLFLNGKIGDSTTWYSLPQPWGVLGNFVLGNYRDFTGQYFFKGNISEVLVYTNRLDISQVQSINDYLTTKYHARKSNIVLDGDSITVSNVRYPTNAISVQVASAFSAAVNVDCTALSGHSSANQLTNAAFWLTTGHPEASANIILDNESANNDFGQGITTAQTESNWLAKATMAHTWGWKYIPCSIISSSNLDLSGNKTVLNAWLLANWSTFADNICRYDQIAAIATNGAWSNNVVFNTDGIHPNDAGMLLEGPVAIAAIKAVLSGTNFSGSFAGSFAGTAVVPSLTQVVTGTPQVRAVNQGSLDNAYDIWYGDHVNRHGDWIIGPADNVADLSSGGNLAWTWRFVNDDGSTPNYGLNGLGYLGGIETNGSLHVYGNGIFSNNVVVSGTVTASNINAGNLFNPVTAPVSNAVPYGILGIFPTAGGTNVANVTNLTGFPGVGGGGSTTFLPSPTVTWSTSGGSNVATVVSSPLLTGSQSNLLSLSVTNTETGVALSGTFTGSLVGNATTSTTAAIAGNLTTINTNNINTNNASQLSSGTVPSTVLSGNNITNATGFFFPAGGGGISAATAQSIALQAATTNTLNTALAYTNNGVNFYVGIPGGNVGNLGLADSVLNQWDTLLGQNGNPKWNGSQMLVAGTAGNGASLTNLNAANIAATTTNYSGTALSFSVPYQSIITNAAFAFVPPNGFIATAYNTTAVDVTNTTGTVVVITPCPGWLTEGTWNVTNITEISLFARAGWTNAIALPLK